MKTKLHTIEFCWRISLQVFIAGIGLIYFSCKNYSEKSSEENTIDKSKAIYCKPEVVDTAWYSSGKKAPLFSGLNGISFPISTENLEAKKYFDQGLMLSYGFNHAEAGRSFYEASRQDSNCAMCWWGYAYVLGPNYNAGMEADNFKRAFDATQKAKSLSGACTEKEKALINALTHRYAPDTIPARSFLDSAYAAELRNVYKKYPDDPNIGALFAESLMDLHPWNLWNKDGSMQPWTKEIITVLENCLKLDPNHAGANHFYIHATEMSQHAESSMKSADLLLTLVPGAGHLVHMPSHTYIRTGRYHDGVIANQKAVLVDSNYVEACHAQGVYPLAYYPHNYHFISACATLSGESKAAMKGAWETSNHAHKELMLEPAWSTLQHYYSIPWFVMVKLGMWDEISNAAKPDSQLKYPLIIWHYAQGMAMLAQNKLPNAKDHLSIMKTILSDSSIADLSIWGINSVHDIGLIATNVLEGEFLAKLQKYDKAITCLKDAVQIEDALNYDEPPDWFFSVRHHLGEVLMEAGKYNEAVEVYNNDLKTFRENGWALRGLMKAYEKLGNKRQYEITQKRFNEAWKFADIKISSSRIL